MACSSPFSGSICIRLARTFWPTSARPVCANQQLIDVARSCHNFGDPTL